ncbi:MAG TPA: hypothetical protein VJJ27_00495 [Candidatus Paceibacterota bacterium]
MGKEQTVSFNRMRYNAIANYLKLAVKRLKEALRGVDEVIAKFAISSNDLARMFADANAVTNCLRQLEQDPDRADINRLQDAGAWADKIATYAEGRKDLERRFLRSQFLVDELYFRIVILPNRFAEPMLVLWQAYDAIRQNGAELGELRSSWTKVDKTVRSAELAVKNETARRRVKEVLAPKAIAQAPRNGRGADKRELDRQKREDMKRLGLRGDDSKGRKNPEREARRQKKAKARANAA